MRHTHTQAGVQTHDGATPSARTKSHGLLIPPLDPRGPCAILSTAAAGPARRWAVAVAFFFVAGCGSAPDPFTTAIGEYDAGTAGTRPARELRRVDVLGSGGATALEQPGAGGSTVTQGDGGPTASSGDAASPAGATGAGGMIAAVGATTLDAGRQQGSGGAVSSGGASTGTGGWMGCKPFLGCAGSGPATCDATKCPGPCPVDQATGFREAFCCTIDAACGCESTDPMWGTRVCK